MDASLSASKRNPSRPSFVERLENRICFSDLPIIFSPTTLTATALSSTTMELVWDDNAVNETSYIIQRTSQPDITLRNYIQIAVTPADTERWIDSNLLPGTDYFYQVFAVTPVGDSSPVIATGTTLTSEEDDFAQLDPITSELTVRGTNDADDILIAVGGGSYSVRVNGETQTFVMTTVARIKVLGLDGNDRITMGKRMTAVYALGGGGNDVIVGSRLDDTLDGGDGNDAIAGGDGNDNILGGLGRDALFGQGGDDLIDGGASHDKILGGDGNDTLFGSGGNDKLFGEGGVDSLNGGSGINELIE